MSLSSSSIKCLGDRLHEGRFQYVKHNFSVWNTLNYLACKCMICAIIIYILVGISCISSLALFIFLSVSVISDGKS